MVFPEVVRASEILTQAKVPLLRKKILIQILNGVRLIKYLLKKKKKKTKVVVTLYTGSIT